MCDPSELKAARSDDPLITIELQTDCSVELFRSLYAEVGGNYYWIDRLPWTDEQIATYLQQPEVSLWLMTYDGQVAGYFELKKCEDGSTEIAYFGLMPSFIGRGLGKHLLTSATEQAWADGANRVWLQTDKLNERSQRAMERIGAKREGELRDDRISFDGRIRTSVVYGITRAEWPAVHEHLQGLLRR